MSRDFDATLRSMLVLHEKKVLGIYKDSLGFWTGGVGRLLDPAKGGHFNEDEVQLMLTNDIRTHVAALLAVQPWIAKLDDVRRAVMYDMTFNLGIEPFDHDGFKDWPIFLNQVKTGQFQAAAENMRSTVWFKQVGFRGVRLANMMATGEWAKDIP